MQSVNQRGGSRATGSRSERLSYCPVILLLLGQAWAQSVLTDFHTLDKMCNAKTESNCTENPVEHLDLEDNVLDHLLFGLNKCLFSNGFWGLPLLFKTRPGERPLHTCELACPQRKQGEGEAETTGAENTKVGSHET